MIILPVQCRMARAALGMGVRELASAAKVSTDTVARFERGEELKERDFGGACSALWNRPELSSSKRTAEVPACDCGNGVRRKVRSKTKRSMQLDVLSQIKKCF